jgi:hypothetical protein
MSSARGALGLGFIVGFALAFLVAFALPVPLYLPTEGRWLFALRGPEGVVAMALYGRCAVGIMGGVAGAVAASLHFAKQDSGEERYRALRRVLGLAGLCWVGVLLATMAIVLGVVPVG